MSYAWNKLRLAVYCLTGTGSQRERLAAAVSAHLSYLRAKDLPSTWRDEFVSVIGHFDLGQVKRQDAAVKRVVETLDDVDVGTMIGSILRLYDAVTRYQPLEAAGELQELVATSPALDKGPMKNTGKIISA